MQQPKSLAGIVGVIGLIFKYAPLILGLLTGLGNFLERFKPAPGVEIDQESLAKLIEELTEREIHRVVNSHKDKIIVWVPSDEEKSRQERLDELEEQLKKDQEEYEKENPKT